MFIGYSDTTALALALYNKTGCITYLSQSVISNFGEFEPFNELFYCVKLIFFFLIRG
ncbi:TPA: LD-carboxypeptidase [Streptococcus pyogenes]